MIRQIFNFIPKIFQEKIKLLFYNFTINDFSFSKENIVYATSFGKEWSIFTISPLYFIVKDIRRYEKYYKVAPGDVILDAGANEGILSLIYSKKSTKIGKVFSFEPDEKNMEIFIKNLELNKNVENIHTHFKGLWNERTNISFYEAGTVGSSIFYQGKNAVKKEINVISIDEFVKEQKLQKLDFIKMDIEGAEIEALNGARASLITHRPNLAIASYHIIEEDYTYKKLESFFREINYPFKTVFFKDGEIITYAGPAILKT